MGNTEVLTEEVQDGINPRYNSPDPKYPQTRKKYATPTSANKNDVPHLSSESSQQVPSFIIKNTTGSGKASDSSKWCRTRVVLLQQTHGSRTILYDSKKSYMKSYPGAHDKKVLGDLVFGSTPFIRTQTRENNTTRNESSQIRLISTKVHYLSYFRQTVVSKLFHLRIPKTQLSEVLFSHEDNYSSDSSSSSFSSDSESSDGGLAGHKNADFSDCKCFECKPLFALVVIFSMFLPSSISSKSGGSIGQGGKIMTPSSIERTKKDSRARKYSGPPKKLGRRKRSLTKSEIADSQQEMMNEKRKMIELQAFLFCSLSVLMNSIEELQSEICRSLRKTIIKVMKKWKKKKKKSINDLISTTSNNSKNGKNEKQMENICGKIYELNLKLSAFILDHDPPFLSHCRHFEEYILTYLHSQKSASVESGRDGGRMVPGGHGFFSGGGGLWQKVLMSGTSTTPKGFMPRTTWKNDGIGFGDPVMSMHKTSSSLISVWKQLEEDILKLIHYISKRKLLAMGWTKDQGRGRKLSGGSSRNNKNSPANNRKGKKKGYENQQQPLERRVVHLTKRFLCSVLTAIFSRHTGWIFPFVRDGNRIGVDDQLESIYGGRGGGKEGRKYCKILVVGSDYKIVRQLLVVLSFFVRSNPYMMKQYSINPTNQSLSMMRNKKMDSRNKIKKMSPKQKKRKKRVKIEEEESGDNSNNNNNNSSSGSRSNFDSEMVLQLYEILPMKTYLDQQFNTFQKKKSNNNKNENENSFLKYTPLVSKNMYFSHHLSIPFGESLVFSEILPKYCPVYVLSAIPKNVDYFEGTIEGLKWDLEKSEDVDSSCCVIVDMNDLMCNVVIAQRTPKDEKKGEKMKKDNNNNNNNNNKSNIRIEKKRIGIDYKESLCSPFVLELFNQLLEIFHWGKELQNQHLLLNNFFNQKLKEAIILAQLVIDWIEKEKNKYRLKLVYSRKKKESKMKKKIEVEEEEEEEEEVIKVKKKKKIEKIEEQDDFLFEIDEKRICRELNIPTNDLCIIKNIVGYLRPEILRCIKKLT